jgi:hypothetical protein
MGRLRIVLAGLLIIAPAWTVSASESFEIKVPRYKGVEVVVEKIMVVPGAVSTTAFRFNDGRIVVGGGKEGDIWSSDGGLTWVPGAKGPVGSKTAIDIGGGEILEFSSTVAPRPDGLHEGVIARSTDNGKTWNSEKAIYKIPDTVPMGGDDGKLHAGMIVHHGAIKLKNGDLMVTLYGTYPSDTELGPAYPIQFNHRKVRTITVTSSDKGKTWGNAVTAGYNTMRARGLDLDSQVVSYKEVPAITQEGMNEADLTRAPNGDLLCVMRSGGRVSVKGAPVFPTPMYLARSTDEGKTWLAPVQMTDRGTCPSILTLDNGIIVCAYSRPGCWIIFSDDNGVTWKEPLKFYEGVRYVNMVQVGPDRVMVFCYGAGSPYAESIPGEKIRGTIFTIKKTTQEG